MRLHHPLNDGAVLVGGALELLLRRHPVPLAFGPLPNPLLVAASYPHRGRKEWREWNFCKTGPGRERKRPYDLAVRVFLLIAKLHLGEAMTLSGNAPPSPTGPRPPP